MKQKLYDELNLDDDLLPKGQKDVDIKEHSKTLVQLRKNQAEYMEDHEIDPSMFYAFTKDFMRIDLGLMI